ncbi:hypothetical protein SLEP1_g59045 [Rubroshorea leprosula]|uniref:Uncharacterized protein n=1 Tax=Rubroshorea leprosula TaxID=152421 RepID=A0AAV5MTN8_9ROSI|nr:hypothetical protein SLEP1_g59045 [Rubroshorea leprosula]
MCHTLSDRALVAVRLERSWSLRALMRPYDISLKTPLLKHFCL